MIAPTTKKNRIVIVDANNLGYAAFFAHKRLNYDTSRFFMNKHGQKIYRLSTKSIALIFGLPEMIRKLIKDLNPDELILCWDGSVHKERMKLNPNYKGHRKENFQYDRKNFHYQKKRVMRLFYILGIKQVHHPDMEADDFIYMLTEKYRADTNNQVVIVSRDKDFFQLIKKNVVIWDTYQVHSTGFTTKKTLKNPKLFKSSIPQNYGYYPKQGVDYLSLVGDKSDDIPGYHGIGHIRTLAFLKKHSSIKKFINSDAEHSLIDKKKLAKLWKLNRMLIGLRLFFNKFIKDKIDITYYRGKPNPQFRLKKLHQYCDKYNLKTFRKEGFIEIYKNL